MSTNTVDQDKLDCRYDDIVDDWKALKEIEVRGVRDMLPDNPEETYCEVDDEDPQFFSVYVRHTDGCSLCIGDHDDVKDAIAHMKDVCVKQPHLRVGEFCWSLKG